MKNWTHDFPGVSDRKDMSGFMSFAETLERKIRKDLENGQYHDSSFGDFHSEKAEFSTDYANLSYILGRTLAHDGQKASQKISRTSGKNPPKTPLKSPYDQYRPKPKPRYPHNLSNEQTGAYTLLCRYSELHPGFQAHELKKAYREAVKAAHPDLGGAPEIFANVQAAYQILKTVLK